MALCKEMFWVRGRSHCKHKYKCQCAFSWQKKEPTKPSTSRLIKAVFFLEKQMCVSRDIANHMAPTQGNTLRWIQFLLILLGDPQNIKNEAKASSQHKSSGGTLSKNGKHRAKHWWDSTPEETTHRSETPSTCEHTLQSPWQWGSGSITVICKPSQGMFCSTTRCLVPQHSYFNFFKDKSKKRSIITQEPFLSESLVSSHWWANPLHNLQRGLNTLVLV